MGDKQDWITEREQMWLFQRGDGGKTDAQALLEHSKTNRDITTEQGQLFSISRFFGKVHGIGFYNDAPDELETVQQNVDDTGRHDYMKVAIEQWQGKLANAKKNVEALT
jgi:hypothetical protein